MKGLRGRSRAAWPPPGLVRVLHRAWRTAGQVFLPRANFLDQTACLKGGWVDRSGVPWWSMASQHSEFAHELGPTLVGRGWQRLPRETVSGWEVLEPLEGRDLLFKT